MQEQDVYGYAFDGVRYDAGTTMGWLKASVELALQRQDIGEPVPAVPADPRPELKPGQDPRSGRSRDINRRSCGIR